MGARNEALRQGQTLVGGPQDQGGILRIAYPLQAGHEKAVRLAAPRRASEEDFRLRVGEELRLLPGRLVGYVRILQDRCLQDLGCLERSLVHSTLSVYHLA